MKTETTKQLTERMDQYIDAFAKAQGRCPDVITITGEQMKLLQEFRDEYDRCPYYPTYRGVTIRVAK